MLNSYGKPKLPFHNPTSKAPVLAERGLAWTCRVREWRRWSGSWLGREGPGMTERGLRRGAEEGRRLRRGRPSRLQGPFPALKHSPSSQLSVAQTVSAFSPQWWPEEMHLTCFFSVVVLKLEIVCVCVYVCVFSVRLHQAVGAQGWMWHCLLEVLMARERSWYSVTVKIFIQ